MNEDVSHRPSGTNRDSHWREGHISRPGLDERGNVFFAAFEMTRMPMVLTDPNLPDNPIVFCNNAFSDLTGYSRDEIMNRNCRFLQGERTDRETVREIHQALLEQRPFSGELLNYRKDGTFFWNALFIGPVFDSNNKLTYFFASQLDVSRRRTSEEAYRQSQKMEAIGQLTAGLAHDFNNTLQVITGNLQSAELKLGTGDSDAARGSIGKADRATQQAARLTQQLLTFARKTRLEPRPVNLNRLLMEFGEMLARTLGSGIELRFDMEPVLPDCLVDPVHAEMALLNVLVNARDAMPEGGRAVLSTRVVQLDAASAAARGDGVRPGRFVALQVEDQGEGMPAAVLDRAVEPFFTTKEPGRGTGLGLAMVHGFARQSGGRLEIDSELGRGTTVRLLFPVGADETYSPVQAETEHQGKGGRETILVVDDSPDVLDVAVSHLEALGYFVLVSSSGEEALAMLEGGGAQPDLLFTDIAMPGGINGLVLAEKARRLRPNLPVLLATGYIEDLVTDPGAQSLDVLGKPYRRAELAARVRAALDRQPVARAAPVPPWKEG